jgi:hypothetical protein
VAPPGKPTPSRVTLRFVSDPPGATVRGREGQKMGKAPFEVTRAPSDEEETYWFILDGHARMKVLATPSADREVRANLAPKP